MNDMAIWEHRISKAQSLEALSGIRDDAAAVMDVEHRPQADRDKIEALLKERVTKFAALLGAG